MDKAMNRQSVLLQHLRPNSSVSSFNYESAPLSASIRAAGDSAAYQRAAAFGDDVVIVAAYRTAFARQSEAVLRTPYLMIYWHLF